MRIERLRIYEVMRPYGGELHKTATTVPLPCPMTEHFWQAFGKGPFTRPAFATKRRVKGMLRKTSKVVSGLVRQCERQSFYADPSMSSETAIEPYAPAEPRNKCLRIQHSGFPKEVIVNGRKRLIKPSNERVSPAAGPMSVGGPDIPLGNKVIKNHNTNLRGDHRRKVVRQ